MTQSSRWLAGEQGPCWVCGVVDGTAKASVVSATGDVLVLISPVPLNPGHVLVVSRRHVRDLYSLPDELAGPILMTAARVARAAKQAFSADGMVLRQHNDVAGGQEVFHFHLHVIPRFVGDDVRFNAPPRLITRGEQEALAERLRLGTQLRLILMTALATSRVESWPSLPLDAWGGTYATLHLWTQIVGKVRLAQSPWTNHSWHVTLYVTARGLTTSPIPYGARTFQIDFDFVDHRLIVQSSDGGAAGFALEPQSVAAFYARLMAEMGKLDLQVGIHRTPNEVADPIRFDQDETHRVYDREYANRFWRVLVQADRVFKQFRTRFIGKCSPVHFFWGAPDLAVTRFSGRRAPEHPGGIPHLPDWVAREAYSHEVSSCGFWPGGGPVSHAAFYSYAYPEPAGFSAAPVEPGEAFYSTDLREFLLPYDVVRQSPAPDETLLRFLQTTYEAAANLAKWDRPSLERGRDVKSAV